MGVQIFFFVGALELLVMKDITGEAEFVGDFRNGFLDFGWDSFDEDQKLQKRGIELNQGRAAMMGILGLMVHEGIDNNPYIINDILGAPGAFRPPAAASLALLHTHRARAGAAETLRRSA